MRRWSFLWVLVALVSVLHGCKCKDDCPETKACDDGNPCTVNDVCSKGACQGTSVDCSATAALCHGPRSCDPMGAAGNCDGTPVARNEGASCDDADPCTSADQCRLGVCKGAAVQCAASAPCRAAPTCSATGEPGNCAVPGAPANEGGACDDSDPCTVGEKCTTGSCSGGAAPSCPGSTACRAATTCDPAGAPGNCAAGGAPINEGGSCGFGQVCKAGECLADLCTARTGTLEVVGLEADHEGGACWNTVAGAPEPAKTGHAITWAPTCVVTAYYYFATLDYVDPTSTAGLHLNGTSTGFEGFRAALAAAGKSLTDVTASITLTSLGNDVEGTDWEWDATTRMETRRYTGGELKLKLDGEDLVGGPMPDLHVKLSYGELAVCTDDKIEGRTDYFIPEDKSASSSAATQAVAAAFLRDVGKFGIRLAYDSLQPIGQTELDANGRRGAFFEAQAGRFEVGTALIGTCP